jgi:RNA polymerase sigma-70 factor (ECF subfamily)
MDRWRWLSTSPEAGMTLRGSSASWWAEPEQAAPVQPARGAGALPPEWFHAHVATLWRIVARLGVSAHYIEDVVQETFITAARRRAHIVEGQERAFLIATAARLSLNQRRLAHLRREVQTGEKLEEHAAAEPDAERLLMLKRLREHLEIALGSLSAEHRAVFVLYELEGFSAPEIARLLELPLGTVASRLGRARAKCAEASARLERAGKPLEKP